LYGSLTFSRRRLPGAARRWRHDSALAALERLPVDSQAGNCVRSCFGRRVRRAPQDLL